MLWFHEVKGYGFIRTDDGERLYVERDGFVEGAAPVGRCAGLRVEFRVDERRGDRVAVDVSVVSDALPGRARRRSGSVRSGSR
jgi:cold shock CspA family protein